MTLQAAEQESLLLRQVAALRRGGHGHDQALDLARKGLRQGALADRVDAALRALAAGGEAASDPLLAGGQAPVESLDHAAAAADAQLSADAALAMVRTYLVVALAGPLLIGCLLGWLAPAPTPAAVAGSFDRPLAWQSLGQVLAILKVAGLPLAVAVVAVVRRVDWRIASGVEQVRRASMLFRAAAIGADPADLLADGVERTWVSARASSCGVPQATAELAEELLRDAEGSLALFRHLAPVVALLVGLVLLIPVFVALMLPIWGSMRGLIG